MAKGLKMYKAKDKYLGTLITIKDIDPDNHGEFICEDCSADIKYTKAHTRLATNEDVDAYLSLKPNKVHGDSCKYNVTAAIQKIVDFSQSVEGSDPAISTDTNGTYVYRLNFLAKALKQITPHLDHQKQDGKMKIDQAQSKVGKDYVLTNTQIASYFRSAAGVVKIKSMIEDQGDDSIFQKKVKIQYKNQDIKWNDFYFEKKDYKQLYNAQYKYPVAIKVFIKDNKIFDNKKDNLTTWSVRCVALMVEEETKTKTLYSIFLHFKDKNLATQIKPNTAYIVLGQVWYSTIKKEKERIYKTANINIFNENQFEEF